MAADLLLASQNPGKLNEMKQLVEGLPFRVLGPRDLGIVESPEETGATFLENARLKAPPYGGAARGRAPRACAWTRWTAGPVSTRAGSGEKGRAISTATGCSSPSSKAFLPNGAP